MKIFAIVIVLLVGLAGLIRLAPSPQSRWHHLAAGLDFAPAGQVRALRGGALLRLNGGAEVLAALQRVALDTARTQVFAGTLAEGRITWVTRSALWGFPDCTTAELRKDGVYIHARLRFGSSDLGVNAARLRGWVDALAGLDQ
jgi:hypothetical protein